jgi:hypothetical protein
MAQDRCIILPLYPQMTAAEVEHVARALRDACTHDRVKETRRAGQAA